MSGTFTHRPTRLRIDPTAWVAPGAVVVGDVTLGAGASIWFNTVLRGDTDRIEVGEESNVQDNSVVHMDEGAPALIGRRVTVGRAQGHDARPYYSSESASSRSTSRSRTSPSACSRKPPRSVGISVPSSVSTRSTT